MIIYEVIVKHKNADETPMWYLFHDYQEAKDFIEKHSQEWFAYKEDKRHWHVGMYPQVENPNLFKLSFDENSKEYVFYDKDGNVLPIDRESYRAYY